MKVKKDNRILNKIKSYEHIIIISSFIVFLVPHLRFLTRVGLCGWDCPWYVWHLSESSILKAHTFTEPLYFWLFKPFVMLGADPVIVMKTSMIAMMVFAMTGVYLLANRLRMNLIEKLLVVGVFALNPLTLGLWDDTLRNFLSFSFLPWLFYFLLSNQKRDIVLSYLMLLMMILSHRMVLAVFPMILIFRLVSKHWKRLYLDIGFGIASLLIMSVMTDKMSGLKFYGFVLVKFLEGEWFGFMPNRFSFEIAVMFILIAVGVAISVFLLSAKGTERDKPIIFVLWYVFLASVLFSKILAHRLILMFGMMLALALGIGIRRFRESGMVVRQIITWMVAGTVLTSAFLMAVSIPVDFHRAEREFIDNIDLPPGKGTILLVPDRLYWYALYKHPDLTVWRVNYKSYHNLIIGHKFDVINHPTPDEAMIYTGVNRIADLWYVDTCSHASPKKECPLVLKYSKKNSNDILESAPYAKQPR